MIPKKKAKAKPTPTLHLPQIKVEAAAAVGDVRYYLNYPYLDLSGKKPVLVATNGHYLLACEVKIEGKVKEGPLPIEAITRARKEAGKHVVNAPLIFDGEMCGTRDVMDRRPVFDKGTKYPKWRNVIPAGLDRDSAPNVAFKAEYLNSIAVALGCGKNSGVGLQFQTTPRAQKGIRSNTILEGKAISIRAGHSAGAVGEKYTAILMPMRF